MEEDTTFEIIDGSPRTDEAVRQRNRDLKQRNGTIRGKWHTVKATRFDESQDDREFKNQGPLISICREPPQNTTDNRLDPNAPVVLRYSIREIQTTTEIRERYLPENPWVHHITCAQNRAAMTYDEDYEDTLLDSINNSVKLLLVEDYNATGLVGNPNLLFPNTIGEEGEYDKESEDNTFFWFMRSKGAKRPVGGRGGSWGLGKLAFPLSSAVRTFFVVTTREDEGRYMAGQAVLKNHQFRGEWFGDMMYFADDDLIGESGHHWAAITDEESINEFCEHFKVERGSGQPGTSMVIPLPRSELTPDKLRLCILSNYCVPIMNGDLEVEISSEEGDIERITSGNINQLISASQWDIGRSLLSAWTTSGRMNELVHLYESMVLPGEDQRVFELGKPNEGQKPNTPEQYDMILPQRGSDELDAIRERFQKNQSIIVKGKMPVHNRESRSVDEGEYYFVFRKCDNPDDAEAHFYRGHISLPLVLDRKAASPGVSSLLVVSTREEKPNPLAELLRSSEGPAHLKWDTREDGMRRQYEYGPSTIGFMREIVGKMVARISSVDTEREDIWTDIFSLGGKPELPDIERRFRIDENSEGGCTITPIESKEDMVGMSFIIRVGYPKPFSLNRRTPPDYRSIDVHSMVWNADGTTITKDVNASNGELCIDRVRMTITEPEFEVVLQGVETELKAQVIITEEVRV